MSSLQTLRPDTWSPTPTPTQAASGGPANGSYSAQVTARNPSGGAGFNPEIPGIMPQNPLFPPGGPQPAAPFPTPPDGASGRPVGTMPVTPQPPTAAPSGPGSINEPGLRDPGYQYGDNFMRRPILGIDQTYGTPVYGSWESYGQAGQFDAQGRPLYQTTGFFNQAGVQGRQAAAGMTPEQRRQALDALRARYAGRLEQGSSGERLPFDAPIEDQNNWDYLQQLISAENDPMRLQFLTSQSQIYGTTTQESEAPDFFARYGINDPNHVSPYAQSQAGLTADANANPDYRTVQGGQTFTDPSRGRQAFLDILNQMSRGGSAIFGAPRPGGTINRDALQQLYPDTVPFGNVPTRGPVGEASATASPGSRPVNGPVGTVPGSNVPPGAPIGGTSGMGGGGGGTSYVPPGSPGGTTYSASSSVPGIPNSIMDLFGGLGTGGTSSGDYNAPGIQQLSHSLLNGDIFSAPSSSSDYGPLRQFLQQFIGGNAGALFAQPGSLPSPMMASDTGTKTDTLDTLGGANSPFFLNMMAKYEPLFQQERARALAQANESAGNLVGSGHANILGNALGRTLTEQQAKIADLVNQQIASEQARQGQQATLAQQRNLADQATNAQYDLSRFGASNDISNANAGRIASLLGALGTAGVSPNEIISQGGLGALIGPLLGALGNSSLGSGLANLGGSLASGLGSLGGSLIDSLGSLGGSLASGLGGLAGGLGDLGGSIASGIGSIFQRGGDAAAGLYNELKPIADKLGKGIEDFVGILSQIPGLDKILESIGNGVTNLTPIVDWLKKIPGLENIDPGMVYSIVKLLAKYGIIRGTGGQIINALPGTGSPFPQPSGRGTTPSYRGPGQPGFAGY